MKSEPCTSLQGLGEESSQISFLDTDPSLQSSGMHSAAKFSESELQTVGLTGCTCGRETFSCLTHPNTKEEWIASMRASLAKIYQSQETKLVLKKAHALDSTERYYALPTWFSLDTCSWKTSQESLLEMTEECSEPSLETLPREGTMRSGLVFPLPKLGQIIRETDGGYSEKETFATPNTLDALPPKSEESLRREMEVNRPGRSKPANLRDQVSNMHMWPTPRACELEGGVVKNVKHENGRFFRENEKGEKWGVKLKDAVAMWPTPRAAKGMNMKLTEGMANLRHKNYLETEMAYQEGAPGGKLNPTWVEWLMGFPMSHTALKHSETDKSHSKQQQPSESSGE